MSTEYTLPDGTKTRAGFPFKIADVGSFPRNWLDNASAQELTKAGITLEEIPDPVRLPPTLEEVRTKAKDKVQHLVVTALVANTVGRVIKDIDKAIDEAAVQAVLDSI